MIQNAAPESVVSVEGGIVRSKVNEVTNGIKGAIDFLRSEFHVESVENFPFVTMLVSIATFFALPNGKTQNDQRTKSNPWAVVLEELFLPTV